MIGGAGAGIADWANALVAKQRVRTARALDKRMDMVPLGKVVA